MRLTGKDGKTYEYLVNGRPAGNDDLLWAFITAGAALLPDVVVAKDNEGKLRAVVFAADTSYADRIKALLEAEKLWGTGGST